MEYGCSVIRRPRPPKAVRIGAMFSLPIYITVAGRNWIIRFSVEGKARKRDDRTIVRKTENPKYAKGNLMFPENRICVRMSESVACYVRICSSTKE
jgi:hypothetical protein